jgi:tRNA G18 (ribose-2'-O)-methylase SpoU
VEPTPIDDPDDPRLELYRGLPDGMLRRRIEGDHGVFVVEGARALRILVGSKFPVVSVLLRPERVSGLADVIGATLARRVPVYVAGGATFDRVAGFPVHRGVLALAVRPPHQPDAMALAAGATAAVIVEGVNDHENLGAIFRNAAALGAQAVLLDPSCCDPLYRRSVRVSVGQVLRMPFTRLAPWPAALTGLAEAGFTIVALDPAASAPIDSVPNCRRPAVMVGAEANGLSAAACAAAAHRVRIPMAAGVDSLNVATALAIALHRLVPGEGVAGGM